MGNKINWMRVVCISTWLFIICSLTAIALAHAQTDTEGGKPVWAGTEAQPKRFDWIQLTLGEWLKGDLKVLYDDSLDFESEELDLLKFDWEDIPQIRCHAPQSICLEDPGY